MTFVCGNLEKERHSMLEENSEISSVLILFLIYRGCTVGKVRMILWDAMGDDTGTVRARVQRATAPTPRGSVS